MDRTSRARREKKHPKSLHVLFQSEGRSLADGAAEVSELTDQSGLGCQEAEPTKTGSTVQVSQY